jgi:hypothetical protein
MPVRASSVPAVQGAVSGIELCEEAVCGAAIFVGIYSGQLGFNPHAIGAMAVAVKHDLPLPDPYHFGAITGGQWQISSGFQTVAGTIASGTLFNNNDNTYTVTVDMVIQGTSSHLHFVGTLDHTPFPPTIKGFITP